MRLLALLGGDFETRLGGVLERRLDSCFLGAARGGGLRDLFLRCAGLLERCRREPLSRCRGGDLEDRRMGLLTLLLGTCRLGEMLRSILIFGGDGVRERFFMADFRPGFAGGGGLFDADLRLRLRFTGERERRGGDARLFSLFGGLLDLLLLCRLTGLFERSFLGGLAFLPRLRSRRGGGLFDLERFLRRLETGLDFRGDRLRLLLLELRELSFFLASFSSSLSLF